MAATFELKLEPASGTEVPKKPDNVQIKRIRFSYS